MHRTKKALLVILTLLSCPLIQAQRFQFANVRQRREGLIIGSGPGPLFTFGQNIVAQRSLIYSTGINYLHGRGNNFLIYGNSVLIGLRDDLVLKLQIPYIAHHKDFGIGKSSGLTDIGVLLEYAFYEHQTQATHHQATIVFEPFIPTGNNLKIPFIGSKKAVFFTGFTTSHIVDDWYAFGSLGWLFVRERVLLDEEIGDRMFYDFGIGRKIAKGESWYLAWIAELTGNYFQMNERNDIPLIETGGNLIWVGGSLRFEYKRMLLQAGVQGIVANTILGSRLNRAQVRAALNFAYELY